MKRNFLLLICIITTMTLLGDQKYYTQSDSLMPRNNLMPNRISPSPYEIAGFYKVDTENKVILKQIAYERSEYENGNTGIIGKVVMNVWVTELVPIENIKFDSIIYIVNEGGLNITSFSYNEEEIKQSTAKTKPNGLIKNMKPIRDGYYHDEDGLYFFSESIGLKKLESSNGKVITPIIKQNYFIYDNNVYSFGRLNKLPLNPDKIKEFAVKDYDQRYLITDGDHIFDTQKNSGYDSSNSEMKDTTYFKEFYGKNIIEWQQLTDRFNLIKEEQKGKIIRRFPSPIQSFSGLSVNEVLVKAPDCFYVFKDSYWDGVQKIDEVYIFNYDLGNYEKIDANQFRYIGKGFYVYKNRAYLSGYPIKDELNTDKLDFLTYNNGMRTDFLYDGKSIIYTTSSGRRGTGEGAKNMLVLDDSMVSFENPPTHEELSSIIRIANNSVFWDSKYIYYGTQDGLKIIPQDKLGGTILFMNTFNLQN